MMKRIFALCLCLLLLPVMALADTTKEREEAMWARIDPMLAEAGLDPESYYHQTIIGDPTNGWRFSVVLWEHPEDENGLYCYILSPEWELILEEGPKKVSPDGQLTGLLNSARGPEAYTVLPDIIAQWKDRIDELPDYGFTKRVAQLDIRHPEEGAISYNDAVAAATAVLLSQPGWTEETLTHFAMRCSAYMIPEDVGRPVWLFYYHKDIYSLPMDDPEAYSAGLARLNTYTINGEPEPRQFSVLIDAMDGSLVEEPLFDYVPVQMHWTDFLTRPEHHSHG